MIQEVRAHKPFQHVEGNREVAAVRSPILDMPVVDWPTTPDGEAKPTPISWIIETGYETLPLLIKPYAKNFFGSTFLGQSMPYPDRVSEDMAHAPEYVARSLGFVGSGVRGSQSAYTNEVNRVTKLRDYIRSVKNKDGSYRISMAVATPELGRMMDEVWRMYDQAPKAFKDATGDRMKDLATLMDKVNRNAWGLFGKDSLDPAKPVDIRIPVEKFFRDGPQANPQLIEDIVAEAEKEAPRFDMQLSGSFGFSSATIKEALEYLKKSITSVRLIGSPTSNRGNLEIRMEQRAPDGTRGEDIVIRNEEEAQEALNAGHKGAFRNFYTRVQSYRAWVLYIEFDVPVWAQECIFGTNKESPEITPADMSTWMQQWFHYMESGQNTWLYRRISDIAGHNQRLLKSGVVPKPRTSTDGLTVHPDWLLLWIPKELPTLDDYLSQLNVNMTRTGEFTFNDPMRANIHRHVDDYTEEEIALAQKRGMPPNKLIYIDWLNNKLSYTNVSGVESFLDLERCMPGKPYHTRITLEAVIYGEGSKDDSPKAILEAISALMQYVSKHGGFDPAAIYVESLSDQEKLFIRRLCSRGYDDALSLLGTGNFQEALISIFGEAQKSYAYMGIEEKDAYDWVNTFSALHLYEFQPDSKIPFVAGFGKILVELMKKIDPVEYMKAGEFSVLKELQHLAVWKVIGEYLGKYNETVETDKAERAVYLNPNKPDPNYKPEGFTLVSDELEFQPHQARIADELTTSPPLALLDVKAGGGKTIQILTNIAYEMNKRHVMHPLVMCPSYLVKDYITEANYTFAGRFNVIVVNSESLKSWGEEKLLKLVKGAPPNTIVVTDYDFLKSRTESVYYGSMEYTVSLNCELLRLMDFDGVWVDEIHFLRNETIRTISAQRLLAEIPFKRGASGTLVVNQLTDIVQEVALFDPTIFGSMTRFLSTYAATMSGGRVASWKPGAEQTINRILNQHVKVLRASRKEWAALLPPRHEEFHYVPLSPGQRALYETILIQTFEKIKEEDPELYAKLVANRRGSSEEDDAALEQLVRVYLARLESFLGAPGEDPDADMLSEEDKVSPKGKKMVEIIRKHFADKIPGKILVFCSHDKVVRTLLEQMPDELREQTIHYTAAEKIKCIQQFKTDSTKQVMIGIEDSMRTGNNLQIASRLIRIQAVWTQGDLEQGESRVNRPNIKDGKDSRTALYFDHIIVNKTIDVTKTARLIANMISGAKFENPHDRNYQALPAPELVSMSYDNLMAENDFRETLSLHMESFQELRSIQAEEYRKYREDPNIPKEFKKVYAAPAPAGSGLLKQVPYVAGMELYGADDLGLEPYYQHLRDNKMENGVDLMVHTEWGDGTVTKEYKNTVSVKLANGGGRVSVKKMAAFIITKTSTSAKSIRAQILKLTGMKALDPADVSVGPVSKVSGRSRDVAEDDEQLNVASGDSKPAKIPYKLQLEVPPYNVWKLGASTPAFYLVTKADNPFKIKEGQSEIRIYKQGDEWIWVDAENDSMHGSNSTSKLAVLDALKYLKNIKDEEEEEEESQEDQEEQEEVVEDEDFKGAIPPKSKIKGEIYLGLGIMNGEFMLSYDGKDPEAIAAHLQGYGFKMWNKYPSWYIQLKRGSQLKSLIEQMEANFDIKPMYMQQLKDALKLFSQGKQRMLHPAAAFVSEFKNFLRDHAKPTTNPKEIKPYVYVSEDDGVVEFYIMVDARGSASNKLNSKVKIPGTRWYKDTDPWAGLITPNRAVIRDTIQEMQKNGVKIANLEEVKEQYKLLNPQKRKHVDMNEE